MAMDVPSGPLNWLPSGLTALILSLERTDSLTLQLKAFSVTQAVKTLLSMKKKSSPTELWKVPSFRSGSRTSLDYALRELAKPLQSGLHFSGFPLASHACQCEDFCECCVCGEPDCALCESCVSEEEFECQCEDHYVVPELQHHQWGFPSHPYASKYASDAFLRRESRPQRFGIQNWVIAQNFAWVRPLERRAAVEEREFAPRGSVPRGKHIDEKVRDFQGVPGNSPSANFSPRVRKDSPKEKVEESPQRIMEASEADRETQKSHETLKPVKSVQDNVASSSGPLVRLSPNWWPFGIQSAAAVAVDPSSTKWNFRMGQNAGAGALAGGVVSLFLHPIDTLKTIVQSQTGGSRNLLPILSSIISERGLKGLYRGLGSNLASSAPISAIYTLTYEAVKAGLLCHIPEDMSALAHCGAGACASVATSIVYTPSECVKQQMQVNGLYQNSWQTFTSLLKQGGLPILYKGLGAVLCRNVPQSVIKFYTYEALKDWVRGDQPRDTPLNTLQALAIGGVAGSTAAFFTTPFDVVKTRLQTQIPGSVQQYNGVIHAFQCIATTEGVAGLYRGLTPRLLIYVTQGALFFASYEFIKHVLAVEVPRLRIKASQIEGYKRRPAPISAEST